MSVDEPPPGLLHRRLVEVAEAAAERDEILVGQLLIPEEQHLMVEPRPMDRGEGLGVERAQIDALDLRAEHRVQCDARTVGRSSRTRLPSAPDLVDLTSSRSDSCRSEQTAPASSSPPR